MIDRLAKVMKISMNPGYPLCVGVSLALQSGMFIYDGLRLLLGGDVGRTAFDIWSHVGALVLSLTILGGTIGRRAWGRIIWTVAYVVAVPIGNVCYLTGPLNDGRPIVSEVVWIGCAVDALDVLALGLLWLPAATRWYRQGPMSDASVR